MYVCRTCWQSGLPCYCCLYLEQSAPNMSLLHPRCLISEVVSRPSSSGVPSHDSLLQHLWCLCSDSGYCSLLNCSFYLRTYRSVAVNQPKVYPRCTDKPQRLSASACGNVHAVLGLSSVVLQRMHSCSRRKLSAGRCYCSWPVTIHAHKDHCIIYGVSSLGPQAFHSIP